MLVVANWKMHGTLASAQSLASDVRATIVSDTVEVALCPPFVHILPIAQTLSGSTLAWGAQNISEYQEGAYTGEVSGAMLADMGCRYVIVGHSERRCLYGETDAIVAAKFATAQQHSLMPILCLGENLDQRETGQAEDVVTRQLQVVIDRVGAQALAEAVIAYEPVWAIGTGRTAAPEEAQAMHVSIRNHIRKASRNVGDSMRIIYGGSVKPKNVAQLFAMPDIDGALVGGASLGSDQFSAICVAAYA